MSFVGDYSRPSMNMIGDYSRGAGAGAGGGAADYAYSQAYSSALAQSGVPPAGKVSYGSIAAPTISGGPAASFAIATSGSFVAEPFAGGAPSLPPAAAPYAPPPMSFGGGLPASGSFVAEPFAGGAPTPDMLGMSMQPRPQGGYPDYSSLPPSSFGMPGGGALGPNAGFGGSPFGFGQTPFVGFDAEVPGKSLGTANFGIESQSSFVTNEGGTGSSGMKPSDKSREKDATQMKAAEAQDPNAKASMRRGSRERDGAAPRTKRKAERRACC